MPVTAIAVFAQNKYFKCWYGQNKLNICRLFCFYLDKIIFDLRFLKW